MEWQPIETAPKDGIILIPLTHGLYAQIDACDYHLVAGKHWHATSRRDGKGHYAVSTGGTRMHRLILGAHGAEIVDHINGDGLDNRRKNIRKGTQSQNCVNRRVTPGHYLRGARPKKGMWQAYIKYRGKQRSLGYYATEQEAHQAYMAAATELHGEWMPLPPPPKE